MEYISSNAHLKRVGGRLIEKGGFEKPVRFVLEAAEVFRLMHVENVHSPHTSTLLRAVTSAGHRATLRLAELGEVFIRLTAVTSER